MNSKRLFSAILSFFLFVSFGQKSIAQTNPPETFTLATGAITSTASDSRSTNFLDLNNDGWEDIFISNGLQGGQQDLLYLNNGDGTFTSVTNMDIVTASNPADGASFVDYNNDGHIDGAISSWHGQEDLLYLNDGNATLNYNANAGIVNGSYAETASFGDYNNDGWLDLYITNSGGNNKNYLYKNLQDGTFERITNHILVNDAKLSRAAIWGDFNNDNIQDLFISNESNATNDFFLGQGGDSYTKVTTGSIATSQKGSMTASWGDIDNDGDFDLFVGNSGFFQTQTNQLFINNGTGFDEVTTGPLVQSALCTFGSAFGDYDNDGYLDLFVTHGYCNIGLANKLYRNQGDGTFVDVSSELASNINVCSFGAAWGDVNNDGFLDILVANCKNTSQNIQPSNTLLINNGNNNNWLKMKLTGTTSNVSAIGAKIRVKATINGQEVWQTREIRSQSGYSGQNSLIAHFGLGDATTVDSIIVDWPESEAQVLENVALNQQLNITEGMTTSTISPTNDAQVSLSVFPNPVSNSTSEVNLSVTNRSGQSPASIAIFDMLGQLQWDKQITLREGENQFSIPVRKQHLPSGLYQLSILVAGDTISTKLNVIR